MFSILTSTPSNKYESCTRKSQFCIDELFTLSKLENNDDFFPLNILIVRREQQKEPRNITSKLSTYI